MWHCEDHTLREANKCWFKRESCVCREADQTVIQRLGMQFFLPKYDSWVKASFCGASTSILLFGWFTKDHANARLSWVGSFSLVRSVHGAARPSMLNRGRAIIILIQRGNLGRSWKNLELSLRQFQYPNRSPLDEFCSGTPQTTVFGSVYTGRIAFTNAVCMMQRLTNHWSIRVSPTQAPALTRLMCSDP